jgi:antitoxin HicB
MGVLMEYKIPLVLTPQPEGGYTVTSPLLPELVTEGDSLDESLANVKDAFRAVMELYQELGRSLPENIQISDKKSLVWLETVVSAS